MKVKVIVPVEKDLGGYTEEVDVVIEIDCITKPIPDRVLKLHRGNNE